MDKNETIMNSRSDILLSFVGVAIVLLVISTPIMSNSTPGTPFKGYPSKGYTNHGIYTMHRYYSNGHWYDNLFLNETD